MGLENLILTGQTERTTDRDVLVSNIPNMIFYKDDRIGTWRDGKGINIVYRNKSRKLWRVVINRILK